MNARRSPYSCFKSERARTNMAAEQDMIQRLTMRIGSKAVQKIDFHIDQIHFVGSGLINVLVYLNLQQAGQPGIKIKFGAMSDDVAAYYDPRRNILNFRKASYGETAFQRMTIIHECVHAWLDVRMPKIQTVADAIATAQMTTTQLSDESAAYIAGALFTIYEYTPPGQKPTYPADWKPDPIYVEAHRIAAKIMNRPGAIVSDADANPLKQAIMDDDDYSAIKSDPTRMAGNDGV
jgi:hypothetical protein